MLCVGVPNENARFRAAEVIVLSTKICRIHAPFVHHKDIIIH